MKRASLFVLIVSLLISCSRKDQFTVEGIVENASGEKIYFHRMDLSGDIPMDSMVIRSNGSFRFRQSELSEPGFFKLSLSPSRFITLLIDSAEHVKIQTSRDRFSRDYSIEGSSGSEKVQRINTRITRLRSNVDSLINVYNSFPENEQPEHLERLSGELIDNTDSYKEFIGRFVMENPRSFASYYALFLTLSDGSQVMNVMDRQDQVYFATIATSLNLIHPESPRVRQLYDYVLDAKVAERQARLIEMIESVEGDGVPELVLPDLDGNDVALSSLRDQVVLLSFWGSWDDASRLENRQLKRIYAQYQHRGFEVYQVGIEQSRLLWENAVLQDELPWINVSDLEYTNSYAARVYNVQRLPANYLLSRDGEIIGKDLFGSRLEERLREIL